MEQIHTHYFEQQIQINAAYAERRRTLLLSKQRLR